MGATLRWKPLKPGKSLPVNAPSSFRDILGEAFGPDPWTLSSKDDQVLRGIYVACKDERKALDEIIEAIEKHGEIVIEVSF